MLYILNKKNTAFFYVLVFVCLSPLFFVSCVSTYVKTSDKFYEDGVLVSETYVETKQGKDGSSGKEKSFVNSTYHDLSNAGHIITASETKTQDNGNSISYIIEETAHSFVAQKVDKKKESFDITYTLIETVVTDIGEMSKNGEISNRELYYDTRVLGSKSFKADKNGRAISSASSSTVFTGDDFAPEDEELFEEVLALTLYSVVNPPDVEFDEEKDEAVGKSYKLEMTTEEIEVNSTANGQYIAYSFLGKPFVIAGSTVWNLIKCVGYSFVNFAGGYQLATGGTGWGEDNNQYWLMPSFNTAKQKFEEAKEENAIKYYPEYHIPLTDNSIKVTKLEENTYEGFVSEDMVHVKRSVVDTYDNSMSVSRSASADATYTSGVVGVIGTGVTIPVSCITWVGGFAVAIIGQMYQ